MSGRVHSLDLILVSCLFLTVQSQTGENFRPQNVSLSWKSDFEPELSWAPPQHSDENCTYEVTSNTNDKLSSSNFFEVKAPWIEYHVMEGGFLNVSVRTVCSGRRSEAVVVNSTFPEVVKNLQCYSITSKQAQCSWEAAQHLRFYYRPNSNAATELQECLLDNKTEDMKTVCNLSPVGMDRIDILFNGTVNNVLVRNTFQKWLKKNVRPPSLDWNVTKTGDKFNISWNPPDFGTLNSWTFKINYTECGKEKVKDILQLTSAQLNVVRHCPYRMTIKAVCTLCNGETPWSEEKYFVADTDPNALVYPAVIVPLVFAGLAALAVVCCRKNREKVFPKVPQPRDLLSDISDNNNKSTVCNLYIPAEEEENCKITLVIDPQISKPIC